MMISGSDSELECEESSYMSQKLSLLRDWQLESEAMMPLPNIKWIGWAFISLILFYVSTLILEVEQEAGLSIKFWASFGQALVSLIYFLIIVMQNSHIHGRYNVIRVFSMPIRKKFRYIFLIGLNTALAGIFYVISLNFANKAGVNHGNILSLTIVASLFVFLLAYRWDKELPTFIQFWWWVAMIAGVVILTVQRPLMTETKQSEVEIELCQLSFIKDMFSHDMLMSYIFGSLSACWYFFAAVLYKYI